MAGAPGQVAEKGKWMSPYNSAGLDGGLTPGWSVVRGAGWWVVLVWLAWVLGLWRCLSRLWLGPPSAIRELPEASLQSLSEIDSDTTSVGLAE
jgi:hypothetical protein